MNLQAEPPEKKKRATSLSSPPPTPPSFSFLPDEITENFLARISKSYYQKLSLVSKTFRSILSSPDLYVARSRLGNTQQCLYVCLRSRDSSNNIYYHWNTLSITKTKKNKTGSHLVVPIPSSSFATAANPTLVGFEIYAIGGYRECSNIVKVLDCRSHTWRDAPSMKVARKHIMSCVYDGKIYVFNKDIRLLLGEVFDIKTQTWECLPEPGFEIRNSYKMEEFRGKIYFGSNYMMYACYDPKQNKWEREKKSATFPSSQCVMDNVSYSFWKNDGRYNFWWRDINGGGGIFKEVKGLDSLRNRYKRHGGSKYTTYKVTSCGGKLYVIWQRYAKQNDMVNNWCAEISVEKRDGDDGDDVWGNVEWLDVIHSASEPFSLIHCLAISL